MAKPTTSKGMGGSNGAAQDPTDYIVPARRVRLHAPANDNKAPLGWRVRRLLVYVVILALIAGIILV
ncbi:hypothetical protein [Azospirillum cavernae]|uniref:hypothetical protein n=1 Tax=Azospirillum cavernae TaxID=2320860 RepID=UPI0011C416CF|nr:hypothetical protein [Azospirillum cavernae]